MDGDLFTEEARKPSAVLQRVFIRCCVCVLLLGWGVGSDEVNGFLDEGFEGGVCVCLFGSVYTSLRLSRPIAWVNEMN